MSAPYPQQFTTDNRFKPPYRLRQSATAIARYPFPFPADQYSISVNLEPHRPGGFSPALDARFDLDEHYLAECADRADTLARDPSRCQLLPHLRLAAWETLELLMQALAQDYPQHFSLQRDAEHWHWINRPLQIEQRFRWLDDTSLPLGPLEYITRQIQGDFCLLDVRAGQLWLDGGMLTAPADWSLDFNLGMNFTEWHAPVPLETDPGVFERALKYLLGLRPENPVRRLNWSLTVQPRLDTSPESFAEWEPERRRLNAAEFGQQMHLRTELQTLHRLPRSQAILFGIRSYLLAFDDVVQHSDRARRLHRVIASLPPRLRAYKGIDNYHPLLLDYLARHDDGTPTAPGYFWVRTA